MKKLSITAIFLGVLALAFAAPAANAQVRININLGGNLGGFYDNVYDELSPYGYWVQCRYGECWVPDRVPRYWQPYEYGEWSYTDYGWTWVSYDPWGDLPYHYGTWEYTRRYGWVWVPGTVWAPAWVTWTFNDRYIGWAPLPPSVRFGYGGYSGRPIVLAATQYVFVPTDRFVGTRVNTVRIAPDQSPTIFRQTTPVTQFGVTGGIVRNDALPINRIQSRTRIERRNIDSSRTTPRPITGWTGGTARSTGQVSVIAPAPEVRQAIGSRPGRGRSSRGNAGNQGTEIRRQPPAPVQPNPGAPVYEDRNRGRGRHEAQPQPAPRVERQPVVAPVQPQPQSNPNEYRGRGRGRAEGQQTQQAPPQAPPPQVQRQQPPPQAQPNPGNVEKPGKGHGQENRGKPSKEQRGQGKAKGKDKDKPE
jgi:hypothetical protein